MAERNASHAAIGLYLAVDSSSDDEEGKLRKRTVWTKPWLLMRKRFGCYENLMRELALEDESYRSWIRMDTSAFQELLGRLRPLITKDTSFREAIDAGECLSVALRYLATGETPRRITRNDVPFGGVLNLCSIRLTCICLIL